MTKKTSSYCFMLLLQCVLCNQSALQDIRSFFMKLPDKADGGSAGELPGPATRLCCLGWRTARLHMYAQQMRLRT